MTLCPVGLSMTTPDPITRRRCFQGLLAGWVSACVDAREGSGSAAQPPHAFGTEWQSTLQRAQLFETLRACAIPAVLVTHDLQDVADAARLTRWGPLGSPACGRARDR